MADYRGEDIETFNRAYKETQKVLKIVARAYRKCAIKTMFPW